MLPSGILAGILRNKPWGIPNSSMESYKDADHGRSANTPSYTEWENTVRIKSFWKKNAEIYNCNACDI